MSVHMCDVKSVAFGLEKNSFLNTFYRMVSRIALPKEVNISDSGTNFISVSNEL